MLFSSLKSRNQIVVVETVVICHCAAVNVEPPFCYSCYLVSFFGAVAIIVMVVISVIIVIIVIVMMCLIICFGQLCPLSNCLKVVEF